MNRMPRTMLRETDVDCSVVEALQRFNIRTVEHLLSTARNTRKLKVLSEALGMRQRDFRAILSHLEAEYSSGRIPSPEERRVHHTGYHVDGDPSLVAAERIKRAED